LASIPEILLRFEQIAYRFDPSILVWPGLIMVAAGLLLWLAGLKMAKVCAVIVGAVAGATIGYAFAPTARVAGMFFGATVAAAAAFIFEKLIIIFLGSLIIGLLVFAVLISGHLDKMDMSVFPAAGQDTDGQLGQGQSFTLLGEIVDFLWSDISRIATGVNKIMFVPPVVLVIILWVVGFIISRFVSALACSTVGTALVFAGMIFLLLYKGSGPLSYIYQRSWFFLLVFAVMAAGGTAIQLLLCGSGHHTKAVEPAIATEKTQEKR
jgi:hypothetical protein